MRKHHSVDQGNRQESKKSWFIVTGEKISYLKEAPKKCCVPVHLCLLIVFLTASSPGSWTGAPNSGPSLISVLFLSMLRSRLWPSFKLLQTTSWLFSLWETTQSCWRWGRGRIPVECHGHRERDAGQVWTPYRWGSIGILEDSSNSLPVGLVGRTLCSGLPPLLSPPGRTVTPSALGSEVERKHTLLPFWLLYFICCF